VVVEVALNDAPQPFSNFRQWLMHAYSKFVLHLFQFGKESLSNTLAQHEERAVLPGSSANVLSPASSPTLLPTCRGITPEFDQARFIRM
jgi:hypothetical protein